MSQSPLKELKKIEPLAEIPVVAVTASAMLEDVQKGKDAGFAAYISKPLNVSLFFKTINRLLAVN